MFDPKASDQETAGVDFSGPQNNSLQKASPAGVARAVGAWSVHRKLASSVPRQATDLGRSFDPLSVPTRRQPGDVCLSLSLSLPFSLKSINNKKLSQIL